jgi:hypothetical protein
MRPEGVHLIPKSDVGALCHAVENLLRKGTSTTARRDVGEENLEAVLRLYESVCNRD